MEGDSTFAFRDSHISSKVSAAMRRRQSSKTIGNERWLSPHLLSNNRCSIMHEKKMLKFLRLLGNYFSSTLCRRMSLWYSCDFYLFTTDCFILFDIIHTMRQFTWKHSRRSVELVSGTQSLNRNFKPFDENIKKL